MKQNLIVKAFTFVLFVFGNGFLWQCVSPDLNKEGKGSKSITDGAGDRTT
jgi:hypothetical protein